ncbi:MAG: hypothetical protein IAE93_13610 [Ignavibacteria bacterium]|nr:hypothetical protein [Ignavibacteria bacterium]
MEVQELVLKEINDKLDVLLRRTEFISSGNTKTNWGFRTHLNYSNEREISRPSLNKLAEKLDLPENQLRMIVEIDGDDIALLKPISGKNDADKMYKASIIFPVLRYFIFNRDIIDTRELLHRIESLGIKHNRHLSRIFKNNVELFIPKNKNGSKNFEYKITLPCQVVGLKLIQELLNENKKEV